MYMGHGWPRGLEHCLDVGALPCADLTTAKSAISVQVRLYNNAESSTYCT